MLLTIKGKEYGLEWGMLAFENLEDELDKSGAEIIGVIIDEISRGRDKTLRKLSFEAIKLWCRVNNESCDLTEFDYAHWLDREQEGSESVKYISDSFHESWYQGKQISKWIEDVINLFMQSQEPVKEGEKKVTAKKKPTPGRKSSKTATSGASQAKTTKS